MATASTSTGTVTYSNSTTAQDDYFTLSADALTGTWNLLANDGGGTKTTLYSLDDGTNNSGLTPTGGIKFDMDLLTKDAIGANNATSGGALGLSGGEVRIDSRVGEGTVDRAGAAAQASMMKGSVIGRVIDQNWRRGHASRVISV